jgi:hypothetical protein
VKKFNYIGLRLRSSTCKTAPEKSFITNKIMAKAIPNQDYTSPKKGLVYKENKEYRFVHYVNEGRVRIFKKTNSELIDKKEFDKNFTIRG